MEQILAQVVERFSNPEVSCGLAIRFFGVFLVLIIVMIAIYWVRRMFVNLDKAQIQESSPPAPEGPSPRPSPQAAVSGSRESTVPDEVAVAIALSTVPDEVAVAVALSFTDAVEQKSSMPRPSAPAATPRAWEEPGSAWKLMGRQQALFRKTSLTRDITPKGE